MNNLHIFQNRIGYTFRDPTLLIQALTHSSSINENNELNTDNERLEFLGDAVLNFIAATILFDTFKEFDVGELTKLRWALVCNEQLSSLSRKYGIGEELLLGKGEEGSGGRDREGLLSDAFEALIGAIFLDSDLQTVRMFLEPLLLKQAQESLENRDHIDNKSKLQEYAQKNLGYTPVYLTVTESGPDHNKEFTVQVKIGKQNFGIGKGRSKRLAEQAAAQIAIQNIDNLDQDSNE